MEMVTLGKTGITVNKNGFGALPIQRISEKEAVCLIRKLMTQASVSLIPPDFTQTASVNLELHLKASGKRFTLHPRQAL